MTRREIVYLFGVALSVVGSLRLDNPRDVLVLWLVLGVCVVLIHAFIVFPDEPEFHK